MAIQTAQARNSTLKNCWSTSPVPKLGINTGAYALPWPGMREPECCLAVKKNF